MRRPTLSLSRSLWLVALVALLLGSVREIRERQRRFERLAAEYARHSRTLGFGQYVSNQGSEARMVTTRDGRPLEEGPETERFRRRYWWLVEMSVRHERAARSPWLPLICPPEP